MLRKSPSDGESYHSPRFRTRFTVKGILSVSWQFFSQGRIEVTVLFSAKFFIIPGDVPHRLRSQGNKNNFLESTYKAVK